MSGDRFDLIVVGCGAAGLSAALSYAAEKSGEARIAVLERASREERGGATRWTSSWFRITAERGLDPGFVPTMERVSGGRADLDYCRTLEREVGATLTFLESNGVELTYFEQPFANGNTGGGLGMPVRGGIGIVEGLGDRAEQTPGTEFFYQTEAIGLVRSEDGAVEGVRVRGPDGLERRLFAPAVVLACGGFEGNKDLLERYLGPRGRELEVIAPTLQNNRGDGLLMAREAGAQVAGQFDMFHGEPVDPRSSKPDAVVYAYPFGIVVNGAGRRFFDEGKDSFDETFEQLAYEIWRDQNQVAFFISDQTMFDIPNVRQIILTDQPPITADTLGALAEQLGIKPLALETTVAEYNRAIAPGAFDPRIRDGKAARLDPPKSNWALPIVRRPFVAYPLTCAITFTFGGLRTDSAARVLAASGAPIPGLYAAGELTGLYYSRYPAGTSVLRSATFGRIAGAQAAAAAG